MLDLRDFFPGHAERYDVVQQMVTSLLTRAVEGDSPLLRSNGTWVDAVLFQCQTLASRVDNHNALTPSLEWILFFIDEVANDNYGKTGRVSDSPSISHEPSRRAAIRTARFRSR